MGNSKLSHADIDEKYGNFSDVNTEIEAIEKFENIKHNSSKGLRLSQRRMIIGFVLLVCLSLVLSVFSYTSNRTSTKDIEYVYENPLAIRFYALRLDTYSLKAHLAMRDLAASEAGDIDRINDCVARAEENIALTFENLNELRALAANESSLNAKLDQLEDLMVELAEIRAKNINYALNGDMENCRISVLGEGTLKINEISTCLSEIVADATENAASSHQIVLSRSQSFDFYSLLLSIVIFVASIVIIIAVNKYTNEAVKLVDESHNQQNEILDELMIMDETLRQNLACIEREAEATMEMQDRYANSLEAANDAIWELNLDTKEFFTSEKWEEITGIERFQSFDLERLLQSIHQDDRKNFIDTFKHKSGSFNIQIRACSNDNSKEPRWLGIRGKWLNEYRSTGSVSDITQKKQVEQYIEYMAYHDSITSLPNRALFVRTLEEALKRSKDNGSNGCVLFIDLDDFKMVNDGHGHDFGDKLLSDVAHRLQRAFGDKIMVARFGGDEFLVLVENIPDSDAVHDYISTVMGALAKPFSLDGTLFYVTASVGVSLFPEDGDDVTQILKNSDAAMYESKSAGRNTFAFYNSNMSSKLLRKSAIADILRSAIENDAVYMVFQPQVCSSTNRVVSCEALMRLKDQGLGFISPVEFIPIAEDTRLIIPLGYWAIRHVIQTDLELLQNGIELDSISVNVSEMQLRDHNFTEEIKKIIKEYNYNASRLHLEITESILLNNLDDKINIFNELRAIGVKIELDDFGTGYSSLNYVRMIPLDVLKIDKCFTDEIGINIEKEGLIDLIVRLARMFDAAVVAEGVETAEQVGFFKNKGDILLQGYYYSKPLEINDFLAKYKELNAVKLN